MNQPGRFSGIMQPPDPVPPAPAYRKLHLNGIQLTYKRPSCTVRKTGFAINLQHK